MDTKTAMDRARELVAKMTLEEKASQLRYDAPAIPRLHIPAYTWWNEALHGVARAGTATVFPQAIGLAATFDEAMMGAVGDVIAVEGRAKYNEAARRGDRDIYKGLTFWSPNVNIFRDPRWGRGHETYGEDPYLTSRLGTAFVKHLQGDGKYMKAAACAKHYAVHSGPEELRHEFDAEASPKDLEETYLPAFEALVREAKVEAVMGAYNRVNGEPCCGSKTLLTDILRKKWGFEGHVVSDCWAIADFHLHHMVTASAPQSAALALKNGCDLNCGNTYLHILQAFRDGLITEEDITRACQRLMAARYKLGLFDTDCEYDRYDIFDADTDAHDALALEAARKSMVLLKNDGLLPLSMDKLSTIAVIGPNADSQTCLEGNYCGTSSRYVTFLEGLRRAAQGKARILYSSGCHLYKERETDFGVAGDRLSEARIAAENADVVLLFVGLDPTLEGEEGDASNPYCAGDKSDLELPQPQRDLVRTVLAAKKPVVTVLTCGSAVRADEGNAVIWTGYPGQAGGTALADILFGKVSPSGRLPITFYQDAKDLPDFTDYSMKNRTYRYFEGTPLYPFGYGLSYARFLYRDGAASGDEVSLTVENQGPMDGETVIEAYIQPEGCHDAPPRPSLCAFARVALKAGEAARVTLPLYPRAFTVVNSHGERYDYHGTFRLTLGGSQADPVSVRLTGQKPLELTLYR